MNLNPFRWSFRAQCFTGFIVCAALLSYAYYVQFDLHIEPCPLCIFQRIVFIVMGLVFLIGAIQNPRELGRRIYSTILLLTAFVGVGIAARHIWVQNQPPDPFAGCAPGWNYMISNFPISKVLRMAFTGSADCSAITWTFLGQSMPVWTLLCYVLVGAGAVWAGFRKR
ncbi:MAG TPA: disulfide bond formation protein B [Rudaea sp.]|jgi:disulfide bond formation protein DsbB|nr:disulfide bond formation protein B [Rudaea sp.]